MNATFASSRREAAEIDHWLDVCRGLRRDGLLKRADVTGGQDIPFEQAFANLAHTYLRNKAPGLLKHELGFQLIEKNEDNDRAVGVFGFAVGPQLIYAPMFFINGEIKGYELMYLKESDTFVPLSEDWVNYLLNRKPMILGEESPEDMAGMGIQRPSMRPFRDSPRKYASAEPAWLRPGLPGLLRSVSPRHVGEYAATFEPALPRLLKSSCDAANAFLSIVAADPMLAKPFVDAYGRGLFDDAIAVAKTAATAVPTRPRRRKPGPARLDDLFKEAAGPVDPRATGELDIRVAGGGVSGLSRDDLAAVKRDGYLIRDRRREKSAAYDVREPISLANPTTTGLYDVLMRPDKFERCLVVATAHGPRGQRGNSVLVRIGDSGDKAWTQTHVSNLYARGEETAADYRDWFDQLEDVSELEKGGVYLVLAPGNHGTTVFEVERSLPSDGDQRVYEVWWRGSLDAKRPDWMPRINPRTVDRDNVPCGPDTVVLNATNGHKITARANQLLLPRGSKVVRLSNGREDDESSSPPPLQPGGLAELQLEFFKTAAELKVVADQHEASINDRVMPLKAAMLHLVGDHGLPEDQAKHVLKQAQATGGARWRVKYAQPYPLQQGGPSAPYPDIPNLDSDSYFNTNAPLTEYEIRETPVDGMRLGDRSDYDASMPPDPMIMQRIQEAVSSGQKEVLDTSTMSNLLTATQDETLIDQHLGDLVKGLDRKGRLLFNLYWHGQRFEDRFGEGDLPSLEDALKNSFDADGELILKLKQRAIEPYPGESGGVLKTTPR